MVAEFELDTELVCDNQHSVNGVVGNLMPYVGSSVLMIGDKTRRTRLYLLAVAESIAESTAVAVTADETTENESESSSDTTSYANNCRASSIASTSASTSSCSL